MLGNEDETDEHPFRNKELHDTMRIVEKHTKIPIRQWSSNAENSIAIKYNTHINYEQRKDFDEKTQYISIARFQQLHLSYQNVYGQIVVLGD